MSSTSENQEQIVRYLLDEMDARERAQVEERLILEPSYFGVISATEDDLILKYLSGNLGDRLHSRFTEVYLESPARRPRVEAASALRDAVREEAALRRPVRSRVVGLRLLTVSAAVVTAVVILLFVPDLRRSPALRGQQQVTSLTFSLAPDLTRSANGLQIFIPGEVQQVQFQLQLNGAHENTAYQAVISNPKQAEVWKGMAILGDGEAVATVPARLLPGGDYTLELKSSLDSGGETAEIYYFRVLKSKP